MKNSTAKQDKRFRFHAVYMRCITSLVLLISMSDVDARAFDEDEKIDLLLDELLPFISTCTERHDSDYPVFHGCVDWHSAIESELIFLETHPKFEMPYGRAWLLRLTIENVCGRLSCIWSFGAAVRGLCFDA
jgi:hypothetical protein